MLLRIAAALLVLWLIGSIVFRLAAGLVHLLLIAAVVLVAVHFFRRKTGGTGAVDRAAPPGINNPC
jgi:hypothetical protein